MASLSITNSAAYGVSGENAIATMHARTVMQG